jgi:hypothetical protein
VESLLPAAEHQVSEGLAPVHRLAVQLLGLLDGHVLITNAQVLVTDDVARPAVQKILRVHINKVSLHANVSSRVRGAPRNSR